MLFLKMDYFHHLQEAFPTSLHAVVSVVCWSPFFSYRITCNDNYVVHHERRCNVYANSTERIIFSQSDDANLNLTTCKKRTVAGLKSAEKQSWSWWKRLFIM